MYTYALYCSKWTLKYSVIYCCQVSTCIYQKCTLLSLEREREREEICPDKVSVTSSGTLCGVLILCNGEPSSALVFENLFMAVNYPHTCQLPSEERLSHYWNFFFICILLCFRGLSSSNHHQFPYVLKHAIVLFS